MTLERSNKPALGILFILIGMFAISVNDMLIKELSGAYPLHQIVLTRSTIALAFTLVMVQFEGGWSILKTSTPFLHILRGVMIVLSNMSFFVALAAIPLAEATALFFVAPLFITLLSIPILGERVGPMRIGAAMVGFVGVLIMLRPWASAESLSASRIILLLPVIAAFTYAMNQVLTRRLGVSSKASAMAVYIQVIFIIVSSGFWLVAGDGRYAEGSENASLIFLFQAWTWPEPADAWTMLGLGFVSSIVGYCLSQAYRMADAATVAPFEYAGLPLAVFWGWLIWADLPDAAVWIGIVLIIGSGLFVFMREQQKAKQIARAKVKARY